MNWPLVCIGLVSAIVGGGLLVLSWGSAPTKWGPAFVVGGLILFLMGVTSGAT